jgi:hypothetical protein
VHYWYRIDYQQRHVGWTSLFYTDEYLRGGYPQFGPREPVEVPACWVPLVEEARKEMALPPTSGPTESPTEGPTV